MKKALFLLSILTFIKAEVQDVTVPNDFTAGTRAVAADVNENFDSLETGINRINDTIAKAYVKSLDYRSDGDSSFQSLRVDSLTDNLYVDSLSIGTFLSSSSFDLDTAKIVDLDVDTLNVDTGRVYYLYVDTIKVDSGYVIDLLVDTIHATALAGKMTAGATEIEGSNFDINGGAIDGVTIGGAAAPTVTDLGSVATCDINGGAIDGTAIGAASASTGAFTTLSTSGLTTVNDTIIASSASGVYMLEDGGSGIVVEDGGNVGIGSGVNPSSLLDVRKDVNGAANLTLQNQTAGNSAWAGITIQAASAYGRIVAYDDGYSDAEYADKLVLYSDATAAALMLMSNNNIEFYSGGGAAADKLMILSPTELDVDTDSLNVAGLIVCDTLAGNITVTGTLDAPTLNTGQGDNELYDMDQNVLTTSAVQFSSANVDTIRDGAGNDNLLLSTDNFTSPLKKFALGKTATESWHTDHMALQFGDGGSIWATASGEGVSKHISIMINGYYDNGGYKRIVDDEFSLYFMADGVFEWYTNPNVAGGGEDADVAFAPALKMALTPNELDLDTDSLNVAGLIVCDTLAGDIVTTGDLTVDDMVILNSSEVTLSTNTITVTKSFHQVDTEGDAALDTLDVINGWADGKTIILESATGTRSIYIREANSVNSIELSGGTALTLSYPTQKIMLIGSPRGGNNRWHEISRTAN